MGAEVLQRTYGGTWNILFGIPFLFLGVLFFKDGIGILFLILGLALTLVRQRVVFDKTNNTVTKGYYAAGIPFHSSRANLEQFTRVVLRRQTIDDQATYTVLLVGASAEFSIVGTSNKTRNDAEGVKIANFLGLPYDNSFQETIAVVSKVDPSDIKAREENNGLL